MLSNRLLASFDFCKNLDKETVMKLAKISKYRVGLQGEIVMQQGDMPDFFYVILSGTVGVYIKSKSSKRGKKPNGNSSSGTGIKDEDGKKRESSVQKRDSTELKRGSRRPSSGDKRTSKTLVPGGVHRNSARLSVSRNSVAFDSSQSQTPSEAAKRWKNAAAATRKSSVFDSGVSDMAKLNDGVLKRRGTVSGTVFNSHGEFISSDSGGKRGSSSARRVTITGQQLSRIDVHKSPTHLPAVTHLVSTKKSVLNPKDMNNILSKIVTPRGKELTPRTPDRRVSVYGSKRGAVFGSGRTTAGGSFVASSRRTLVGSNVFDDPFASSSEDEDGFGSAANRRVTRISVTDMSTPSTSYDLTKAGLTAASGGNRKQGTSVLSAGASIGSNNLSALMRGAVGDAREDVGEDGDDAFLSRASRSGLFSDDRHSSGTSKENTDDSMQSEKEIPKKIINLNDSNVLSEMVGQRVAILPSGRIVGELAMINGTTRAASIICMEDCEFMTITATEFRDVLRSSLKTQLQEKVKFLNLHLPLQPIKQDADFHRNHTAQERLIKSLSFFFQTESFSRGQRLVTAGQMSSNIYLITKGECSVIDETKSNFSTKFAEVNSQSASIQRGQFREIGIYKEGQWIGAESALLGKDQARTIVAHSLDVQAYSIKGTIFTSRAPAYTVNAILESSNLLRKFVDREDTKNITAGKKRLSNMVTPRQHEVLNARVDIGELLRRQEDTSIWTKKKADDDEVDEYAHMNEQELQEREMEMLVCSLFKTRLRPTSDKRHRSSSPTSSVSSRSSSPQSPRPQWYNAWSPSTSPIPLLSDGKIGCYQGNSSRSSSPDVVKSPPGSPRRLADSLLPQSPQTPQKGSPKGPRRPHSALARYSTKQSTIKSPRERTLSPDPDSPRQQSPRSKFDAGPPNKELSRESIASSRSSKASVTSLMSPRATRNVNFEVPRLSLGNGRRDSIELAQPRTVGFDFVEEVTISKENTFDSLESGRSQASSARMKAWTASPRTRYYITFYLSRSFYVSTFKF